MKLNPVGQMAASYSEQPIVQALAKLIPGMGPLDTLLKTRAQEIAEERARIFFEELESNEVELTKELILSEDFVHRFVITAKVAANTRKREKIRRFACLLKSSLSDGVLADSDDYEECLQILEELSEREYLLLSILEEYEKSNPFTGNPPEKSDYRDPQEYRDITRAQLFWTKFLQEASERLVIPIEQIRDMLARLIRTGCYQIIVEHLFFDKVNEEGKLTSTWFKIRGLVEAQGLDNDPLHNASDSTP